MSSIWTPSGEHQPRDEPPASGPDQGDGPIGPDGPDGPPPTAEEIAALRELHARLVSTPVEDVIANHALGIWQLALVHLGVITPPDETGQRPVPNLAAAGLAIDALAALVDGLGERLGATEAMLRDALTQAQVLFVEVSDAGPRQPVSQPPFEPIVLSGRHVRLEPLALDHVDGLVAAAAENRTTYAFAPVPEGEAEVRAVVEAAIADRGAGRGLGFATIRLDDDRPDDHRPEKGRVVGSTRFLDPQRWPRGPRAPDHLDSIEIGSTWIAASAQRTVVNTEAKLLMLTHAFEELGVHRVVLNTDVRNERSRAAIARIGATFEGVLRGYRYGVEGTPRDTATFAIPVRDWPEVRGKLEARLTS